MIPSRLQSEASPLPARGSDVRELALAEKLHETFLKMRDLLEEYAPAWYSDDLREKVEAVVQHAE